MQDNDTIVIFPIAIRLMYKKEIIFHNSQTQYGLLVILRLIVLFGVILCFLTRIQGIDFKSKIKTENGNDVRSINGFMFQE